VTKNAGKLAETIFSVPGKMCTQDVVGIIENDKKVYSTGALVDITMLT
jgi:hypothetical protein